MLNGQFLNNLYYIIGLYLLINECVDCFNVAAGKVGIYFIYYFKYCWIFLLGTNKALLI